MMIYAISRGQDVVNWCGPEVRHSNKAYRPIPDSKVHGADTGPIWGRQDPGGPNVGHMNLAICGTI